MGKGKTAKKGIVGRIFRTILAILCLLVIFVTGIGLVLTESSADPVSLFGWRAVSANGRLTDGEIEPGSLALLRAPDAEEIVPGDRVVYPVGYDSMNRVQLAIHSVSAVEEGDLLVLSDTPLPTVRKSAVFGKVVLVVPYLGDYLDYAATSYGMLLAFGLPLVVLILLQIISLILGSRRRKAEDDEEEELPWAKTVSGLGQTQAFSVDDGSEDELFVVKKPASPVRPAAPAEPPKEEPAEQPFRFQRSAAPDSVRPAPDAATREFAFPVNKERKNPAVKAAAAPKPAAEATPRKPYIAVQGEAAPSEEAATPPKNAAVPTPDVVPVPDAVTSTPAPDAAPVAAAPTNRLVFVEDSEVAVSKLLSELEGMQNMLDDTTETE